MILSPKRFKNIFQILLKLKEIDILVLHYPDFDVVAIKAIHEQQDIIDLQQQKISNLEERLGRIEKLLTK